MAIDIYSTRAQLAAIEQMPRVYSFLYDLFASDMGAVEDDKAIYDFKKGSRRMAPVVHKNTGGVLMERDGYETREIGFATIAPERIITSSDITDRSFGEKILGALTPEQRARKMLAQDLMDMREAIQRRREFMVRQVLLEGKLDMFRYTNEGRDVQTTLVADYGFTNKFTPTTTWDQSGAKIDDNMKEMYDMVYEGLGTAEVIVMDPKAASAMQHNSDFMKTMDYRNANMGEINTRYVGQGVRFLGYNQDGVEMYSFSGRFVDDSGKDQAQLPAGTVLIGSRGMLKVPHGPVTQVEEAGPNAVPKTYIQKEVPLRYGSIEGNAVKNRLTSRPTVVPFNVSGWVVGNVL